MTTPFPHISAHGVPCLMTLTWWKGHVFPAYYPLHVPTPDSEAVWEGWEV